MGLVLLVVIWLITFASTYFFVAKTWWLPTAASAAAAGIDHHFATTYLVMGIVFVTAQVSLGYFAWKYRERPSAPPARYVHGNNMLEIVYGANGDPVYRAESDEQLDLGVGTVSASRTRRYTGRSNRDAVPMVLSLSGPGWQIRRHQAGVDRRVRGRRERDRSGHNRPRFQRRHRYGNHGGPSESRSGIDFAGAGRHP